MRAQESPCVNVCTLDERTQSCLGCGRTLDEIEGWTGFTDGERAKIDAQLASRRARFEAERVEEAASTASRWPARRCSRCGAEFACGGTDCSTPCWCASYPPVSPAGEAACMCPACLAATAALAHSSRESHGGA